MKDEMLLLGVRANFFRSLRIDGGTRRLRSRLGYLSWLGWRQWLVLFGMGAAVIIIEVRNHTSMWEEHNSGQTIWTDSMLVWEIILFGLFLPILAGVIFGYMARTALERDQIAKELQLRRGLVARMQAAKSRLELAEVIVTIPGNTALADRAWLLAHSSEDEEFEQIAHWERPGSDPMLSGLPVTPAQCESCTMADSRTDSRILQCYHSDADDRSSHFNRYCLWLTSEDRGKATLLFDTPAEHRLDMLELKVLDELGDEISLAMENANLLQLKQRQSDAARDERLRIARNLHDTVGQNVSYLRLKLDQLSTLALNAEPAEFQNELTNTVAVTDEIYEQMRDTLEELRATEHEELEQAVRHYAAETGARTGISVRVQTIGQSESLSARRSRQIMYILREALNNVEKHADARNADIYLQWGEDELRLVIRDDGQGLQSEDLDREGHYGLAIMDERSRAIDAKLTVGSIPGQGTEITLSLPLLRRPIDTSKYQ